MCNICEQFTVFQCAYCPHLVKLTEEALRHHEDTEHPQLVLATLRAQLRLAQDLQRSTQSIVTQLAILLHTAEEEMAEQVKAMEQINETYSGKQTPDSKETGDDGSD